MVQGGEHSVWRQGETGPWAAPAKLNLMLRIVGRRPTGYHDLQTVFQFLDLTDHLYFEVTDNGAIERLYGPQAVPLDDDLAVKAARLLQTETGCSLGARLRLDKQLPMGGGLGGGSSDAATTLAVLNRLWELHLPEETLRRLGLRLGADVPVFLFGRAAWAEGVGEQLAAVSLPEPWYLVLQPACHVGTAEIFQDPELTRNSHPITIRDFFAGCRDNDCLNVVLKRYPPVGDAMDWLARFAEPRLTGTGACVFADFPSYDAAVRVLEQLPNGAQGFVAKGRNRSPLLDQLL